MPTRSFHDTPTWTDEAVARVSVTVTQTEQPGGTSNAPSTRAFHDSVGVAVPTVPGDWLPNGRQPLAMTVVPAPLVTWVLAVSVYFARPLCEPMTSEPVDGAAFGAVTCAQMLGW